MLHGAEFQFLSECGLIQFLIRRIIDELEYLLMDYAAAHYDSVGEYFSYYITADEYSLRMSQLLELDKERLLTVLKISFDDVMNLMKVCIRNMKRCNVMQKLKQNGGSYPAWEVEKIDPI
jgi:hypothetical protein